MKFRDFALPAAAVAATADAFRPTITTQPAFVRPSLGGGWMGGNQVVTQQTTSSSFLGTPVAFPQHAPDPLAMNLAFAEQPLPPPMPFPPNQMVRVRQAPRPIAQPTKVLKWNNQGIAQRTTAPATQLPFASRTSPVSDAALKQVFLDRQQEHVGGGSGLTTLDPLVMQEHAGAFRYRSALGGVLVPQEGFAPWHINQLFGGDCYWEATMAGLAECEPQVLDQMFEPTSSPDACWVHYYYRDPVTHEVKRDKELVHDSMPMVAGPNTPAYSRFAYTADGRPILWPSMGQKAYAKSRDKHGSPDDGPGYDGTCNGGVPPDAYFWATGRTRKMATWPVEERTASWRSRLMARWNAERRLADEIWSEVNRVNEGHTVTMGSRHESTNPKLYGGHAYTVARTRIGHRGERLVVFRNPHGSNPDACDELPGEQHQGVLELPVEQVRDEFFMVCS